MTICARCGEDGQDRRTLWMACFYAMSELKVPFKEVAVDVKGDTHPFRLYTLRVCKSCRAKWMNGIEAWFLSGEPKRLENEAEREKKERGLVAAMRSPPDNTMVTVCDECRCASCWQGTFMCDEAQGAGTMELSIKTLRSEARENPFYWGRNMQ